MRQLVRRDPHAVINALEAKDQKVLFSILKEKYDFHFSEEMFELIQRLTNLLGSRRNNNLSLNFKIRTLIHDELLSERQKEKLRIYMNEYFEDFENHLKKEYPALTENEFELLCLSRLGFSRKDISTIYGYKIETIYTKYSRIKHKMNQQFLLNLISKKYKK